MLYLYPYFYSRMAEDGWAATVWEAGDIQFKSPSQDHDETKKTRAIHTLTHRDDLKWSISLTCLFLVSGRKNKCLEKTHTCKLHRDKLHAGEDPVIFCLWSSSSNCTTAVNVTSSLSQRHKLFSFLYSNLWKRPNYNTAGEWLRLFCKGWHRCDQGVFLEGHKKLKKKLWILKFKLVTTAYSIWLSDHS